MLQIFQVLELSTRVSSFPLLGELSGDSYFQHIWKALLFWFISLVSKPEESKQTNKQKTSISQNTNFQARSIVSKSEGTE